MQGTQVWSLVWKDSRCCRARKPMCLNYWACALEPVLHKKRSHCNERAVPACSTVQKKIINKRKRALDSILKTETLLCQQRSIYSRLWFTISHIWMWQLGYKEIWVLKNWCFWTVLLEKTLESPLDCKEMQPVHPKGNRSWIFIGRTDAEAETSILWPPDVKKWLIWKDTDAGIVNQLCSNKKREFKKKKRHWCWKGLKAGGEGDDRRWDGWMASPTQWTRVWVNSGSWWWTGRPAVLYSTGLQRVGHDWVTELNLICPGLVSEKEMTTYSSTLAWKIPGMEVPGRL